MRRSFVWVGGTLIAAPADKRQAGTRRGPLARRTERAIVLDQSTTLYRVGPIMTGPRLNPKRHQDSGK
jgi:hypothetical protein